MGFSTDDAALGALPGDRADKPTGESVAERKLKGSVEVQLPHVQDPEDYVTGSGAPAAAAVTLEQALGVQVRSIRRELDLTVSDLAGAASISVGMLSKIENGQISPSLATLQAISKALNVPITTLFSAFEERRDCSFVRAHQGVIIERRGTKVGHQYELLGHGLGGDIVVEPCRRRRRPTPASATPGWSSSTCSRARCSIATRTAPTTCGRATR